MKTQEVDPDVYSLTLTNLRKFTVYDISVSAFTVRGYSNASTINCTTDEDSKNHYSFSLPNVSDRLKKKRPRVLVGRVLVLS